MTQNSKKLRILMLEDSRDDAGLIERVLQKESLDYVVERVETREEYDNAIRDFEPDVVLSDHGLPQFNSIEALKICLKERKFTPFILVTGTVSEEFAATCLKLGADDYILKTNLSRLPSAIYRALKERRLNHLKSEARRALRRQNEALLQANNELTKVNFELDNFVYSVSHNLRAPLTSVMGLLNLAKSEDKDDRLSAIHEMMRTSIMRLDETLKEILDYSRNARNEVILEPIDVANLIHAAIEKLGYMDLEKLISWKVSVQQNVPFRSDKSRLEVILNNVFANAIAYRDERKTPVIEVNAEATEQNLNLIIKDNGIGIDENLLPKIFNMFFRATEKSSGAGLGLYVVRETVKRLQGSVDVASVGGEGTTVTLILPNNSADTLD